MRNITLFLMALLMCSSCRKEKEATPKEAVFNDPNWIKLAIPDNREANAVFGSIEDTLLVSTIYNTYKVADKGRTFIKLKKAFNQRVYGFVKSNDTLYALTANHLKDGDGLRFASYAQNYSLDNGQTWNWTDLYQHKVELKQKFEAVVVGQELSFSLKENIAFYPGSTTSGEVLKSDLIIHKNGSSHVFKLPFQNQLTSLHLDDAGRLYISATSSLHDEVTKKYNGVEDGNKAIVYVSKRSIKELIGN